MSAKRRRSLEAPPLDPAGRAFPRKAVIGAVVALLILAIGLALWTRPGRTQPNLLLITLDTLRADRVGAYGYAEAETPVLDALAAQALGSSRSRVLSR